jgi:hypothetical protein
MREVSGPIIAIVVLCAVFVPIFVPGLTGQFCTNSSPSPLPSARDFSLHLIDMSPAPERYFAQAT